MLTKLAKDSQSKQQEVLAKFNDLQQLATSHIDRGASIQPSTTVDHELATQFESNAATFELTVKKTTEEKQRLREEIA